MAIKKLVVLSICIVITGCATLPVQDNRTERQVIDVYDNQGNVKEHVIIKEGYITIYDKDWKAKGYGKVRNQE